MKLRSKPTCGALKRERAEGGGKGGRVDVCYFLACKRALGVPRKIEVADREERRRTELDVRYPHRALGSRCGCHTAGVVERTECALSRRV